MSRSSYAVDTDDEDTEEHPSFYDALVALREATSDHRIISVHADDCDLNEHTGDGCSCEAVEISFVVTS